jgi:hypothetical protein
VVLATSAAMTVSPAIAHPLLGTFLNFDTGSAPVSVAVGDLDGDGKPDLVTANAGSNTVSVLLGNGNGTFAPKMDYGTDLGPRSVAIGDVNGDGMPDLVTSNYYYGSSVSVLLGKGNGTFATATNYPTSSNPNSVAIGDLNGDGKLDLVTASLDSNKVTVLVGNGHGSFQRSADFPTGSEPFCVAIGDLDGDGKPDLVTANAGGNSPVSVLLAIGNGAFAPAAPYGTGEAYSVAIGDVDGDLRPDLVTANAPLNTVSVLQGNGKGVFSTLATYATGAVPFSVAIGDFNGDTRPDLVTANYSYYSYTATVTVLLGSGGGFFEDRKDYGMETTPISVAIGDMNGDGKLDLVTADPGYSYPFLNSSVSVLLGIGDGRFPTREDYGTGDSPWSVAIGDLNGDGKLDLVTANSSYGSDSVSVLLGHGNGTFDGQMGYHTGTSPRSVAIGDLNGDGKPDLVVAGTGSDSVSVLLGNGNGTFPTTVSYSTGIYPVSSYSVAIGDLNGDGKPDLVVASTNTSEGVSVLLGQGNGTFPTAVPYYTGGAYSVAIGDLNGDSKPDLVAAGTGPFGGVTVLLGSGDGTFPTAAPYAGGGSFSVAIGDLNGDGKPDLVTASGSNTVQVRLGKGGGTFGTNEDYVTGGYSYSVAIGDLNGDGKPDLVAPCNGYGISTVSVLLGEGNGRFAPKVDYGTAYGPFSASIGDLNGDGKLDVVTTNAGTNTVSVLLNVRQAVVGVPRTEQPVARLQLRPAQPNPFLSATSIRFDLPAPTRVKLEILDLEGRRVATLVDGSLQAGPHVVAWTGRSDHGNSAPAGIYFDRLVAPSGTLEGRIVRLR